MKPTLALFLLSVCAVSAAPVDRRLLFGDGAVSLIHDIINTIGQGVETAVHTVGNVVNNVGQTLGVGAVANTLTGLVNSVVDGTTNVIAGAANQLVDTVKSNADGATLGLANQLLSVAHLRREPAKQYSEE